MNRVLIGLAACLLLAACGRGDGEVQTAPVDLPHAAEVAPPPKPHYVVKDGDEYGYQGQLSEDEIKRGQAASALRMYTYLGQYKGAHQVMNKDGQWRTVAECESPCMHVKVFTFNGDRFVRRELYSLNPAMLLAEVFQDAIDGHLEPLRGTRDGKLVQLWVDGEKKTVVHLPVNTSPKLPVAGGPV